MATSSVQGRQYRDVFSNVITHRTASHNVASLADGAGASESVTVPGAALGDFVRATFGVSLAGITVTAYVSAANTVQVRVQNESGGIVDLAATVLRILVEQPNPDAFL